jgi:hypothetical protein
MTHRRFFEPAIALVRVVLLSVLFLVLVQHVAFAQGAVTVVPTGWQGWALLAYPLLTALASLLAKLVEAKWGQTAWLHAFLSVFASLGIDLPTFFAMIYRTFSTGARQKAAAAAAIAKTAVSVMAVVLVARSLTACAQLPAVVDDVANIAKIVIADVEKGGMTPEQVIADVAAQTGVQDAALVLTIVESLLADPKVPATDMAPLQSVQSAALAKATAQKAAAAAVPAS